MQDKLDPLHYDFPDWLAAYKQAYTPSADLNERTRYVISAARQNIANGGGPFAAAVLDTDSNELVSLGVNMVTQTACSVMHAEISAIMQAQAILATYDLSAVADRRFELISSTEPCTMCLGAIHWSGIKRLVFCTTDADARAIGFDEGPKPDEWMGYMKERGIEVIAKVERERARQVLKEYREQGGVVYNAGTASDI